MNFKSSYIIFISFLISLHVCFVLSAKSAADYYVSSLPGLSQEDFDTLRMFAGEIALDPESKANMFFWLVDSQKRMNKDKLIVWLNGGPGCSSMDGILMESGPLAVVDPDTLKLTNFSWHESASVLYVDQPVGAGFSSVDSHAFDRNETSIAHRFVKFLDEFYDLFPQYKRSELYIAGESFAGTYIPFIANQIVTDRKNGIALGNGWMDPIRQYEALYSFSVARDLLSGEFKQSAQSALAECRDVIEKKGEKIKYDICETIVQFTLNQSQLNGKMCLNMYDIRLRDEDVSGGCGVFGWPPTLKNTTKYLSKKEVWDSLHISKNKPWVECEHDVSEALDHDESPPSYKLFPNLLNQIKILLFVGKEDLVCNYMGIEAMVQNMEWGNARGFSSPFQDWYFRKSRAGQMRYSRNVSLVVIDNASHMPSVDVPGVTREAIYQFIGINNKESLYLEEGKPFDESKPSTRHIASYTGTIVLVIVLVFIASVLFYSYKKGWFRRAQKPLLPNTNQSMPGTWKEMSEEEEIELFHYEDERHELH